MSRVTPVAFVAAWFVVIPLAAGAEDKAPSEKEKIEALIKHVEGLKGAKFIRNGREYDAETAAKFLRGKWEAKEKQIKTARDFIEKVATKSGTSGKAYQVRLKDGTKKKSAEYLTEQLKKIEKGAGKKPKR
jgi:hypothetical protein